MGKEKKRRMGKVPAKGGEGYQNVERKKVAAILSPKKKTPSCLPKKGKELVILQGKRRRGSLKTKRAGYACVAASK